MIKYSIIIPTQNRAKILQECLDHILQLRLPKDEFEVIVMDNGSVDNTRDMVDSYQGKILHLVYKYDARPGLHVGRNVGGKIARGEILCFIDDDSFVSRNWLRAIEQTFQNPDINLATGRVSPKYEVCPPKMVRDLWQRNGWGRYLYKYSLLEFRNKKRFISYNFIFGCNFIIRKKLFEKYKGFNPDGMPMSCIKYRGDGENALACKCNNDGIVPYYNPQIAIKHLVAKNRMTAKYMEYRAMRSAISDGFKKIREKMGILVYGPPVPNPPRARFGFTMRHKKINPLLKHYETEYKKYSDWFMVEYTKNKKLQDWIGQDNFFDNMDVPECADCNFSFRHINIFSGEPIDNWILGKFAKNLKSGYEKYGVLADLSYELSTKADFNQCIIYLNCSPDSATERDVIMITHVDQYWKFELLEKLLPRVALGICMSKEQMNKLINMGLDKNKLCYVNPAHDGVIPVKKWVVGLASRVYSDGRKNETYFNKLADVLDPRYFKFKIMGANWAPQVNYMRSKGFEVEYWADFNYEIYTKKFFADMDYYLYMGTDEGQMGFVDAQSAGVKTIVTAQGYHMDSDSPITHPFMTYDELEKIFLGIQAEKMDIVGAMHNWTWQSYALKHLQIFEYLKSGKIIQNDFRDGLNSLLLNRTTEFQYDEKAKQEYIKYLKREIVHRDINYLRGKKISWIQKVFSIRRENKGHIIRILGIKIKIGCKK